jgi:hypothetical protein
MRIGSQMTCDLFNSCKKNPFVATLASGQSAAGFLKFMGQNAVQTGKTIVNFEFSNDPDESMVDEMFPCDLELEGE